MPPSSKTPFLCVGALLVPAVTPIPFGAACAVGDPKTDLFMVSGVLNTEEAVVGRVGEELIPWEGGSRGKVQGRGGEGAGTHVLYCRSRMIIDPRIPRTAGMEHVAFSPTRQIFCLHQARSAVRFIGESHEG